MCLLYNIDRLQPNRKIKSYNSDIVTRKTYALFKCSKDGVEIIRVTLNDWKQVDIRNQICITLMYSLRPAIPLGMGKSGLRALITHPAAQTVSPRVRSCLLSAKEEESSSIERKVRVLIPICFLFLNERLFTLISFKILTLSFAFKFDLQTAAVIGGSCKEGDGEVTEPNVSKGVFPWLKRIIT